MTTQNILLLTATITPSAGVPNLARIDPTARLQDYRRALEFYLSTVNHGCNGIIFAENSNSDVSSLRKLVEQQGLTDRVEFVVFNGLDYPPHYDRGYGEFKLIDYAMKRSTLLTQLGENAIVWKVTGRYIARNLSHLIASQPPDFDLYCNFRNFPKRWVDTFLMAWTPAGYRACLDTVYHRLKTNVPEVPHGMAAEELLRRWLEQQPKTLKLVRRLKQTPRIDGVRGADNSGYSTQNLWKFRVRSTCNRLLPWVWI